MTLNIKLTAQETKELETALNILIAYSNLSQGNDQILCLKSRRACDCIRDILDDSGNSENKEEV